MATSTIIITQWALDSYLDLKHGNVFSADFFDTVIAKDVMRLQRYPKDPKFDNGKFWSIAKFKNKHLRAGYKMKWHQVGSGKVQLRLPVGMSETPHLCQAYVKTNEKKELRMLAKFKTHLQLIEEGHYVTSGEIS